VFTKITLCEIDANNSHCVRIQRNILLCNVFFILLHRHTAGEQGIKIPCFAIMSLNMIDKNLVQETVEEHLKGDEFVVDVTVSSGNKIMVLLDADNGITIERCVAISRAIEQSIDREEEDFELEVSSAGLSESLRLPRQYKKNVGRSLEVVKADGQKLVGLLLDANDEAFTLEVESLVKLEEKKRKQKVINQHTLLYADVKSALVVISFR
jgi:ribosome maturation factor RimP